MNIILFANFKISLWLLFRECVFVGKEWGRGIGIGIRFDDAMSYSNASNHREKRKYIFWNSYTTYVSIRLWLKKLGVLVIRILGKI